MKLIIILEKLARWKENPISYCFASDGGNGISNFSTLVMLFFG
jgi:hypothetical protein